MKTILAPRASAILYNLLIGQKDNRAYLLPANICPIVPITFFKAGRPFEFVDISAATLHMDLEQAEGKIRTGRYSGLLYAHTYGDPSTPQFFFREIKNKFPDLLLIDDRCLCIPDLEPDSQSNADLILYSTGYAKIVDQGFGGYAFLNEGLIFKSNMLPFEPRDLEKVESSYKQSLEKNERYIYIDSNWLQTEAELPDWMEFVERLQPAIGKSLAHRQAINAVYNSVIPSSLCFSEPYQLWRFNVRLPDKEKTLAAIFDAKLYASSHYASLAGIMGEGACPTAQQLAGEVINLFNDINYTVQMAERTAQIVLRSL